MSPYQAVAVAVRLFAIWLVVDVVPGFLWSYTQLAEPNSPRLFLSVSVTVVAVVVGLALWFFPQTVARKLLAPSSVEPAASVTPDTWLAMGCALIGIWILARYLPAAARDLLVLLVSRDPPGDTSSVKEWLLFNSVETAIGVWLLFGAKGLRRIFWWARSAGVGESSNNRSRGP